MSFADADLDLGQIGGLLRWDPPNDIGSWDCSYLRKNLLENQRKQLLSFLLSLRDEHLTWLSTCGKMVEVTS